MLAEKAAQGGAAQDEAAARALVREAVPAATLRLVQEGRRLSFTDRIGAQVDMMDPDGADPGEQQGAAPFQRMLLRRSRSEMKSRYEAKVSLSRSRVRP